MAENGELGQSMPGCILPYFDCHKASMSSKIAERLGYDGCNNNILEQSRNLQKPYQIEAMQYEALIASNGLSDVERQVVSAHMYDTIRLKLCVLQQATAI